MKVNKLIAILDRYNADAEINIIFEKDNKCYFKSSDEISLDYNQVMRDGKLITNANMLLFDIGKIY